MTLYKKFRGSRGIINSNSGDRGKYLHYIQLHTRKKEEEREKYLILALIIDV